MRKNKIYREWLTKAEEDFGFAKIGLKESRYYAQICFHFHQAAEKYLKAFIIANHLDFRPVHNLIELLNICKDKDHDIEELEEACQYLNAYVWTRIMSDEYHKVFFVPTPIPILYVMNIWFFNKKRIREQFAKE